MALLFTAEELKQFKVVQLKRLADYYSVKYNNNCRKSELIELLMITFKEIFKDETEEPQMSVRIRRIKESMEA